ncbi:MAG: type IV toxin-antitoxin system AbiEi family antitoxin domain-containing protein [Lapillicoccus sp.]
MDDALRPRLSATGVLTTRQAADLGVDHHRLARHVREGELVRVRAGVYVDGERHRRADPLARDLLEVRAMLTACGVGYAAAHLSAVAVHGLPVLERDLGPVELAGVETGTARRDGRLRIHPPVPARLVTEHDEVAVVRAPSAVLEAEATTGLRAGLVAADAGLHRRAFTPADLEVALVETPLGRGRRTAVQVVRLADARSESPGETWTRLLFHQLGVAPMELQAVIHDEDGRFVARVDLLDRAHRLVVEFDGALKYAGGGTGQAALVAEKRREDAIRRLGYRVLRLVWADLLDPARLLRLVRTAQQGCLTPV